MPPPATPTSLHHTSHTPTSLRHISHSSTSSHHSPLMQGVLHTDIDDATSFDMRTSLEPRANRFSSRLILEETNLALPPPIEKTIVASPFTRLPSSNDHEIECATTACSGKVRGTEHHCSNRTPRCADVFRRRVLEFFLFTSNLFSISQCFYTSSLQRRLCDAMSDSIHDRYSHESRAQRPVKQKTTHTCASSTHETCQQDFTS